MSDTILAKAVAAAQDKLADVDAFDAVVKFDMGGDGAVLVDGRVSPPAVSADGDAEPDCVIAADAEVFQDLMTGALDPTSAFMTGKLSIDGDMGVAMKLAQALA